MHMLIIIDCLAEDFEEHLLDRLAATFSNWANSLGLAPSPLAFLWKFV